MGGGGRRVSLDRLGRAGVEYKIPPDTKKVHQDTSRAGRDKRRPISTLCALLLDVRKDASESGVAGPAWQRSEKGVDVGG
jgi:hypothetical protein